jgi:hypothetical protein
MRGLIQDPGFRHQASSSAISMPSVVPLPHQCDRAWRGARTPRRKLIVNPDGSPWLYFDLEKDPWESTNLADDPGRADEIRDFAARFMTR